MKVLKIKSYLFLSSIIALVHTSSAVLAMETEEDPKLRRAALKMGDYFVALTNAGKYEEVLMTMSRANLPMKIFDTLILGKTTSEEINPHSQILNVVYSYLHSCNRLGQSFQNREIKTAFEYYQSAVTNGDKFWDFYKNFNEPRYNDSLIRMLHEITEAYYSLTHLQYQGVDCAVENMRKLVEYGKIRDRRLPSLSSFQETPDNCSSVHSVGVLKYNYLIYMLSYLPHVKDEKEFGDFQEEINRVILYLKESKHELYEKAIEQRETLTRLGNNQRESKPLPAGLSRRGGERLKKKVHERKAEELKKITEESEESLPPSTVIRRTLQEIEERIKTCNLDYVASKRRQQFIQSHQEIVHRILKVEKKIFEYHDKVAKYEGNKENLYTIYMSGAKILMPSLTGTLLRYLICFINSGDYENALLRSEVYQMIAGRLPKKHNLHEAYLKFMLGEPADWDRQVEENKKRNQEKRKARSARMAEKIKEELEQKKPKEKERTGVKPLETDLRRGKEKEIVTIEEKPQMTSFPESALKSSTSLAAFHEETRKEKKHKHWSDYKMEYVHSSRGAPQQKEEEVKGEAKETPEFTISGAAYKLYRSLYSISPRFTPEGASKLLGAFGMQLGGGKGSHKKLAFVDALNGNPVLNQEQKEIFRFPNLVNASYAEGSMMVIPRWEGNNPPRYMIGALRYILEKSGIKETNVHKKNEKKG